MRRAACAPYSSSRKCLMHLSRMLPPRPLPSWFTSWRLLIPSCESASGSGPSAHLLRNRVETEGSVASVDYLDEDGALGRRELSIGMGGTAVLLGSDLALLGQLILLHGRLVVVERDRPCLSLWVACDESRRWSKDDVRTENGQKGAI